MYGFLAAETLLQLVINSLQLGPPKPDPAIAPKPHRKGWTAGLRRSTSTYNRYEPPTLSAESTNPCDGRSTSTYNRYDTLTDIRIADLADTHTNTLHQHTNGQYNRGFDGHMDRRSTSTYNRYKTLTDRRITDLADTHTNTIHQHINGQENHGFGGHMDRRSTSTYNRYDTLTDIQIADLADTHTNALHQHTNGQ